jgi:hypothetical protein
MIKKRTVNADATSRVRQIAEKARPNMQVVDVVPASDELQAAPDAIVPEIERGFKAAITKNPAKELHMVVMEPKKGTDERVPNRKLTLIVDDEKVVGEQG